MKKREKRREMSFNMLKRKESLGCLRGEETKLRFKIMKESKINRLKNKRKKCVSMRISIFFLYF